MEEKNKYTTADFERYHAGTMPPGEMYALERAALEDPFLEDALEGYAHSSDAKRDIEELKRRLAEKRKKRHVFLVSSISQNRWLRIAALFIVVAGGGFLFYRLNFVNSGNSIAEIKMKGAAEQADSVVALKREIESSRADTVPANSDIAFESKPASKFAPKDKIRIPEARMEIDRQPVAPEKKAITEPGQINAPLSKEGSYAFDSPVKKTDDERVSRALDEYELKGKVTDDVGNPVPFATIADKGRKRATTADAEGHFLLTSKDSSITAMATATGYEAKTFLLKKDVQPTVAMKKNTSELTAVVVTTPHKNKQLKEQASTSKSLEGKVAVVQIQAGGPQPAAGQEKFDQYIKENASPVYDENNEQLSGEISLSFTIDKKGRPRNIKVVKSSCEACEEEAIRLLEKGPEWIGVKDAPGTILIKF